MIEKWRIDANLPIGSVYYGTGNQIINDVYNGNINCVPILDFEAWNNEKYTDVIKYEPIDNKNLFLINYQFAIELH